MTARASKMIENLITLLVKTSLLKSRKQSNQSKLKMARWRDMRAAHWIVFNKHPYQKHPLLNLLKGG